MSRKLEDLDSSIFEKASKALKAMKEDQFLKEKGVETVSIIETRRSLITQMAYYSRGRMNIDDVKAMYKAAGLYNLSDSEAKTCNTWTLKSKHIEGKAIDLCPVINGKNAWNADKSIWERMGKIGEENGLTWGGRWEQKDLPHFEI